MKKIFCVILCLLILPLSSSISATNNEQLQLSDLSQEECITFLKERGVVIPSIPEDEMAWAAFAKDIIVKVEENANVIFMYGSTTLLNFANDIKDVVNEYYERTDVSVCNTIVSPQNILQDSTVYGAWKNDYLEYNCYAYAIGEDEGLNPGVSLWLSLGNNADQYYYNHYANMYTITSWVQSDLEYFGYTVNSITDTQPNTAVGGHVHLICVRKDADGIYQGTTTDGVDVYFHDYHFMKLEEDGYWYHKPGETNPLRYHYQPTNERSWLSEGYGLGNDGNFWYFVNQECTYDSEIYFIEYSTPHTYVYASCGSNQHISTCTICGETTGTAENCNYEYYFSGTVNGTNTHSRACTECDYIQINAAICFYKNSDYCFFCGTHKDTAQVASLTDLTTME